jgi:hypothetical protein
MIRPVPSRRLATGRRLTRILAASLLLFAAVSTASAALPRFAVACSCMALDPNVPFTGKEDAVLLGTVGADDGTGLFSVAVERWFKGGVEPVIDLESGTRRMADGTISMNTCGLGLETGQVWILVAHRNGPTFSASNCGAHGDPRTPEGAALIAAARRTFGAGLQPGAPPGADVDPPPPGLDLAVIAIGAVSVVIGLVVLVVLLNLTRRRDGADVPPS